MGVKASLPTVPGMEEFAEYFSSTWISGNYRPITWNIHDLDDCRMNNHLEGWHSKLKKVVGKAHPNVFEIVCIFKMEQAAVEVSLAQLQAGAHPPPRSRATVEKDKKIAELKRKFASNEINLDDYIRGLSGYTNFTV